jgi:FkbM family methyltransferase
MKYTSDHSFHEKVELRNIEESRLLRDCTLRKSRSQHFADISLLPFLLSSALMFNGHESKGLFVELGAVDGFLFSNTIMLEQCYNWTGLLIEAEPKQAKLLINGNRRAEKVHSGICEPSGYIEISGWHQTSGNITGSKGRPHKLTRSSQVPCSPLRDVMKSVGMKRATFLSLDVEGAEWEVIKTVDPRSFDIIFVEADGNDLHKDKKVTEYIQSHGLLLVRYFVLGKNKVFIRPELALTNCGDWCYQSGRNTSKGFKTYMRGN